MHDSSPARRSGKGDFAINKSPSNEFTPSLFSFYFVCMKPTRKTPESIDEYIATFPANVQAILQKIRVTIAKAAPEAKEAIKYQLPTFVLNGNLVHFGAFQKHIGFYATPTGHKQF